MSYLGLHWAKSPKTLNNGGRFGRAGSGSGSGSGSGREMQLTLPNEIRSDMNNMMSCEGHRRRRRRSWAGVVSVVALCALVARGPMARRVGGRLHVNSARDSKSSKRKNERPEGSAGAEDGTATTTASTARTPTKRSKFNNLVNPKQPSTFF